MFLLNRIYVYLQLVVEKVIYEIRKLCSQIKIKSSININSYSYYIIFSYIQEHLFLYYFLYSLFLW